MDKHVKSMTFDLLLRQSLGTPINSEKRIAITVLAAQKMREESYDKSIGDYTLSIETCLMQGAKTYELSDNMWALLALAMHWWNDIQSWAEDVLSDRKVIDSCVIPPRPDDTIELTDKGRKFADEFRESRLIGPSETEIDLHIPICDTTLKLTSDGQLEVKTELVNLCDTCESIAADCDSERETIGNTNHVIKCASYHKQDRMVNLCDTCMSNFQECDSIDKEYGDGTGNDNIIVCSAYTIRD